MFSIIRKLKNLVRKTTGDPEFQVYYNSLTQFSHDLKNNLLAIRASCGNIKYCMNSTDRDKKIKIIDNTLQNIEKKINHSMTLINMMNVFSTTISKWPADTSILSIKSCIYESINNYPYLSDKSASLIKIVTPVSDFAFNANKQLIDCVFYCLIRNVLHANNHLEKSEAYFELQENAVHVRYLSVENTIDHTTKDNLFALGTINKPGYGLEFIRNVLKRINGNIELKQQKDGMLNITLLFNN